LAKGLPLGHCGRCMKILSNFLPLLAALLLLATALWWPGVRVPPPLRLAVGLGPGTHSFLAASYEHKLDDVDLRLIEMAWPSAAIRAMQNDVVDGTILSLSEAVRVQADGYQIVVAGALSVSSGADAVMSLDLKSMAELKGQRVGIEPRSCANHILALGLSRAGLKISDVELVEMNLPETVDALLSGEVDAVATAEPFRSIIEQSDGHCLFDSSELGGDIVRVLVTSAKSFDERREQWTRVGEERDKSLISLNPPLLEALARRENLSPEKLLETRKRCQTLSLSGSDRMSEEELSAKLKKTAAAMAATGQISPLSILPEVRLLDHGGVKP
jgi:hypothetical protein